MTPGSSKPKRRRSVTVLEEGTTPKRVRRMGRLEITVAKTPSPTGEPSGNMQPAFVYMTPGK